MKKTVTNQPTVSQAIASCNEKHVRFLGRAVDTSASGAIKLCVKFAGRRSTRFPIRLSWQATGTLV